LVHGREARLPELLKTNYSESAVGHWYQRFKIAKELAVKNHLLSTSKYAKFNDMKATPHLFDAGQKVLLKVNYFIGKNKKFAERFEGPYTIVKKLSNGLVEIDVNNRIVRINVDRIKIFHDNSDLKEEPKEKEKTKRKPVEDLINESLPSPPLTEMPTNESEIENEATLDQEENQNENLDLQPTPTVIKRKYQKRNFTSVPLEDRRITRAMTRAQENANLHPQQQQQLVQLVELIVSHGMTKIDREPRVNELGIPINQIKSKKAQCRQRFLKKLPPRTRNLILTGDPYLRFDPCIYEAVFLQPQLARHPVIEEHFGHILPIDDEAVIPPLVDQEAQTEFSSSSSSTSSSSSASPAPSVRHSSGSATDDVWEDATEELNPPEVFHTPSRPRIPAESPHAGTDTAAQAILGEYFRQRKRAAHTAARAKLREQLLTKRHLSTVIEPQQPDQPEPQGGSSSSFSDDLDREAFLFGPSTSSAEGPAVTADTGAIPKNPQRNLGKEAQRQWKQTKKQVEAGIRTFQFTQPDDQKRQGEQTPPGETWSAPESRRSSCSSASSPTPCCEDWPHHYQHRSSEETMDRSGGGAAAAAESPAHPRRVASSPVPLAAPDPKQVLRMLEDHQSARATVKRERTAAMDRQLRGIRRLVKAEMDKQAKTPKSKSKRKESK